MFDTTEALCTQFDSELFFAESLSERDYNTIKGICAECPVMQECLTYAVEHDVIGIWAGTNYVQRKQIRKEKGIQAIYLSTEINAILKDLHMKPESIRRSKYRNNQKEEM